MRTLPYGTQKNKKSQAYGSGDGGGGNIVQGAHQPAFPNRRRNLFEGRGCRAGRWKARFFSRRVHRPLNLCQIFSGAIIDDPHPGKNQNYLKNKVKLKKLKR
jgi:hypothetical protein